MYKSEQVNERCIVQAKEQGASEGAMDGTNVGIGSKWRHDGWYKSEQVNERWMVQAMDHGAIDVAMNDACDV